MKGLLRIYYYSVEKNLKSSIKLCCIIDVVAIVLVLLDADIYHIAGMAIGAQVAQFGTVSLAVMQSGITSKWNKFEITLPISKADVINARYISFLLYTIIGLGISCVGMLLLNVAVGAVTFAWPNSAFAAGLIFSLIHPATVQTLILMFGMDKFSELSSIASAMNIAVLLVITVIPARALKGLESVNFISFMIVMIVMIVLFLVSYFTSLALYKNREL